jgi:hypothetical protein
MYDVLVVKQVPAGGGNFTQGSGSKLVAQEICNPAPASRYQSVMTFSGYISIHLHT